MPLATQVFLGTIIWLLLLAQRKLVDAYSLEDHYIVALKNIPPTEAEKHVHTVRALHQEFQQSEKYAAYEGVKGHYRQLNMYALHTTDKLIQHLREHYSHQIKQIGPDAFMPMATLEDDIREQNFWEDPAAAQAYSDSPTRDFDEMSYHYEERPGAHLYMDVKGVSTENGPLKLTNMATFHQARISHRTLAATKRWRPSYTFAFRAPPSIATPILYVLDSGVVADHPEFEGRVSYGETTGKESNPRDISGHGTACMSRAIGKLLGTAPNGLGVSIKVHRSDGNGTTVSSFLAGLDYVARQPVLHYLKVINLSIGIFPEPLEPGQNYHFAKAAVDILEHRGIHIVWAAGNDNIEKHDWNSPEKAEGVMRVGSVNNRDEKSFFSNFGTDVRIAAPGEDVVVAAVKNQAANGYKISAGTSLSAPMVAGVMMQVLAAHGPMEPWVLRHLLMSWTTVEATGAPRRMPMRILYNNSGL